MKVDSRLCIELTNRTVGPDTQSKTPCPAWRVEFDSVSISLPSWHKEFDSLQRDFYVLIDSLTGRLIVIYSTPILPKTKASAILKEAVSDTLNKIVRNVTPSVPAKSFASVLDQAVGSNPSRAVQIVATCVVEQPQPGEPVMCVWHIWGIGVHPFSFHREYAPDELGIMLTKIDATTGRSMIIEGGRSPFE
ncbi:hypothetical protein C3F09_06560 [candidate division GN15 bacterium]|uniref:Uncharacterized protein n=1 Tax=candidate division GN15 bacterium TaxID=2072418 RepID=A0A855X612_9BACT|nr:MAG: hypothetical protein C3F09_06560 [candidate division GN15 bacterium]